MKGLLLSIILCAFIILANGRKLIFSEEFNEPISPGKKWQMEKTSAYEYQTHNPNYNKLDWVRQENVKVENGFALFTASPSGKTLENGKQAWYTGLISTEYTSQNFMVRTGNYIEAKVQLTKELGSWPGLWTWKDGNNEIDSFEYHPNTAHVLELSNHVRPAGHLYSNASEIYPGAWVTVGTLYGATSVKWFVNGKQVFSDNKGVGINWSASVILNLSISAGDGNSPPNSTNTMEFRADYVRVYNALA